NVARASLEELKLDYEDFLRQNQLLQWAGDDPRAENLIAQRCQNADEVRSWVNLHAEILKNTCGESRTWEIATNAILILIRVAISLLEKQLSRLAQDFTQAGGFTERLYSIRKEERSNQRIKSRFDD
ncbi:MAG: four helix bundle suffix domain-containing protein, partial [Lentisphaeria bacterium]|nr:four helix bundle suffix domain-containing protein [Lentisphaeria bacterium]